MINEIICILSQNMEKYNDIYKRAYYMFNYIKTSLYEKKRISITF